MKAPEIMCVWKRQENCLSPMTFPMASLFLLWQKQMTVRKKKSRADVIMPHKISTLIDLGWAWVSMHMTASIDDYIRFSPIHFSILLFAKHPHINGDFIPPRANQMAKY